MLTAILVGAGRRQEGGTKHHRSVVRIRRLRRPFAREQGNEVHLYTLTNRNGMRVNIITYGGIIQSIEIPGRRGDLTNVALGFDNLDQYVNENPYFGNITGRYANRIAGGQFELNGTTYQLATNNGPDHLHGGDFGFDKRIWAAEEIDDGINVGLRLSYTSSPVTEGRTSSFPTRWAGVLHHRDDDDRRRRRRDALPERRLTPRCLAASAGPWR